MKRILLGVTGSISAYKSADLANFLTKKGYQVDVVLTEHAAHFITPLTLQSLTKRPIYQNVMSEVNPAGIQHIDLAKQADLFIVAPASAHTIGKLAHGLADDLLSTVALALPNGTPKLIAPAMNTQMYQNLVVQKNLTLLTSYGYQEIVPRSALLACGDYGKGALATVETIIEAIDQQIKNE